MAKLNQNGTDAYLDRLSTEQLEDLLRADLVSQDQETEEGIFAVLEVLEKREREHPTGRLPDVERAWADFQRHYNIPEGEGQSLYPAGGEPSPRTETWPQRRARPRKVLVIAAVLVVLLGGMLTVQAAGINLFGAIGRWTEEHFQFDLSYIGKGKQGSVDYSLLESCSTCGFSSSIVPAWYPDGFEASAPQVDRISGHIDSVRCLYTHQEEERTYTVEINRYYTEQDFRSLVYEKDGDEVEVYQRGEKTFYIFSNQDTTTAAWSDGAFVVTVSGQLTRDEIKTIVDFMGYYRLEQHFN